MPTGLHCLVVGGKNYWEIAIVNCGRPGITGSVTDVQGHDEDRPDWLPLSYQLMSNNMIRARQEVQQYFLFEVAFCPSVHPSITPFPLMGVVIALIDRTHQLFTYPNEFF